MKDLSFLMVPTIIALVVTATQATAQSTYEPYTFSTLSGNAGYGSADATASAARFHFPKAVAVDSVGNVYVADSQNDAIRKVTAAGVVTTLAGQAGSRGSVDGTGSTARFNYPSGVAVESAGNVYVADTGNNTIRKVTPAGVVTTLAGWLGNAGSADATASYAQFYQPEGLAVDGAGNVYVADTGNNTIRKVTPAGVVTTLAGQAGSRGSADGTGSAARFESPCGVAVDGSGNVYVADTYNDTIRKMTPAGVVTTLAGWPGHAGSADGTGSAAQFHYPSGVAVDSTGNVYVADSGNNTIRKVTPAGVVTTLAGLAQFDQSGMPIGGSTDGTGSAARFGSAYVGPIGVAVDAAANVYVADEPNHTIRKITSAGVVTTVAGLAVDSIGSADGTGSAARFNQPTGVTVDGAGNVYVADSNNNTIRKVTPAGAVTTLAGLARTSGSADGMGSAARFYAPHGLAVDGAGNIYVADTGNNTIRKVTSAGAVTTVAGLAGSIGTPDGMGSAARFYAPYGVAVDGAGNVYLADTGNNIIRKVTSAGAVTTVAGLAGSIGSADGTGSAARFWGPCGVAMDGAGNVYVADENNHTIRKVTPAGAVTTLAGQAGIPGSADGTGSAAQFHYPSGVAVDSAGNVYVADTLNDTIRKLTPAGAVTTLAGLALAGSFGSTDGTGSAARFNQPSGVAADRAGNVYVADTLNNTIRKGYSENVVAVIRISGPGFGFNEGLFGFILTGPAALTLVVEASTDLVHWLPIWTNTSPGTLNFRDPQSGVYSHRFYRAHTP